MASDDTESAGLTMKDIKKAEKRQKKAKKKARKRAKEERKVAKRQAKLRKRGVFLDDLTTAKEEEEEEEVEVVEAEEFEAQPWVRKSTQDIPFLEKKIDMMGDRREKSDLHSLFEERYGESLMTPETYSEYELTDAEKRRLEAMRASEEEVPTEAEIVSTETEEVEAAEVAQEAKKEKKAAKVPGELKSFWYPFHFWLYSKYGKDQMIVVKIIILIISFIGFLFLLVPRIVIYFIILNIVKVAKGRGKKEKKPKKDKKAKKKKKKKKAASDA
jgi:hypothetical protein